MILCKDFSLNNHRFSTTRGDLVLSSGNSFTMKYRWYGILPHYPSPENKIGKTPWRPEVMEDIITEYASNAKYGSDTYWGGKYD